MKICPKCGAIAEFNVYYGRTTCTRCSWEDKESEQPGLVWLLIDVKDMENTLPEQGQPIYLSIAEGEGKPFTDPVRSKTDRAREAAGAKGSFLSGGCGAPALLAARPRRRHF